MLKKMVLGAAAGFFLFHLLLVSGIALGADKPYGARHTLRPANMLKRRFPGPK